MLLLFRIAFRNVFRQRRRTLLTILTMFGGFTLCAFSIAWSDGTYGNIIDAFTRYQLGHVQIHRQGYLDRPSLYDTIDNYTQVTRAIEDLSLTERTAPRIYTAGLASVGDKSAGVRIIGIDPSKESAATLFHKKITRGNMIPDEARRQVLLGEKLTGRLDADVGDEVVVLSQAADGSIANEVYELAGIVSSGDPATDQTAFYLHIQDAQELLALEGRVHEIAVVAKNLRSVARLNKEIDAALHDSQLVSEPWQVFAKSFYQAMKADQDGMWITLIVIVLVVAVGVLNTVLMCVLERTREYGLLRAVGTRPTLVFGLVLIEVSIMAVISVILGCIVAYILNYFLSLQGMPMPAVFTYGGIEFDRMYTEINLRSFLIPAVTVVGTALLVSILPAARASRTAPAAAMRAH